MPGGGGGAGPMPGGGGIPPGPESGATFMTKFSSGMSSGISGNAARTPSDKESSSGRAQSGMSSAAPVLPVRIFGADDSSEEASRSSVPSSPSSRLSMVPSYPSSLSPSSSSSSSSISPSLKSGGGVVIGKSSGGFLYLNKIFRAFLIPLRTRILSSGSIRSLPSRAFLNDSMDSLTTVVCAHVCEAEDWQGGKYVRSSPTKSSSRNKVTPCVKISNSRHILVLC